MSDERLVLIHGFSRDDTIKVMRAVKSAIENDPQGIAFTTTTPTNLEWPVKDLIREVRTEHEYMRQNPPTASPADQDLKEF
ncbi:MAG: DUF3783 domain-containing protein [Spirochaetales bacterium]|nr:DUF3783 domain-containing protein [Spirochaetales bacterium]